MEKTLSLAAMEKILKNEGADRVSQDALVAMKDLMEEFGRKVARRSIKLAEHAGRKTVHKEDIRFDVI